MKSVFLALMLILQIASGLSEEFPLSQDGGLSSPVLFVRDINPKVRPGPGDCIRKLCLFMDEGYKIREDYSQITCKCRDFLPNSIDGSYKNTRDPLDKRSVMDKGSYLLMKLQPLLNRGVGQTSMKMQNRYRRLGVRLGSEFLGKRNIIGKDTESWDVDLESIDGLVSKRTPSTELLGKRWGSEMLGKRNVEMLGKRGGEFLGKRDTEFLGKRAGEFLGKRGTEFLGKRAGEFLGKRGTEFLGKRAGEFLGKRDTEFLGKRAGEFLGKRGTEFLEKRAGEFLGKRDTEFLGKRGYDVSSENGLISRLCKDVEDGPAKYVSCPTGRANLFDFVEGANAENDTINNRSIN